MPDVTDHPATVKALLARGTERLAHLDSGALDAEYLLRALSGLSRGRLLAEPDALVAPSAAHAYGAALARRAEHEPLQYILGKAAFWRDEFIVTPSVLIPRPETEILVELTATRVRDVSAARVLDVGTGSGCLGLSILRELPSASLVALDLSREALLVAEENARALGLSDRTRFALSCWYDALAEGDTFDAIVSNPPYVALSDRAILAPQVRDFEPALALFADERDDLSSYRALVDGVRDHLRPGGFVGFEVGIGQADRVARLFEASGFAELDVVSDLAGIPRVVAGRAR